MGKWFGKRKSALHGKHVLVTGGTGVLHCVQCAFEVPTITHIFSLQSEGIGLEIAKEAVSRGALVTVCSRSSDKVNAAVATLQAHAAQQGHDNPQRRVFGAPADVTHAGQVVRGVVHCCMATDCMATYTPEYTPAYMLAHIRSTCTRALNMYAYVDSEC